MNNTVVRAISGSVYVILIVFLVLYNSYTVSFLFLALMVFGLLELNKIMKAIGGVYTTTLYVLSILLFFLFAADLLIPEFPLLQFISVFIVILFTALILFLFKEDREPSVERIGNTLLSVIYLSVPISLALQLVKISNSFVLLSVFIFLWSNDTFAFVVGKSIGRKKLFESISPKKTVEGFIGGLVGAILAAVIISYYHVEYSALFWIVIAVVVSISGTFGDLFESLLKRKAGIKDSGHIMPGHGGVLDRIDSFLFSIPFCFSFVVIFKYLIL